MKRLHTFAWVSGWIVLALASNPGSVCLADASRTAEPLRYTLACSLDEERSTLECEADVWIRVLRDSLTTVSWVFPPSSTIVTVQDEAENAVRRTPAVSVRGGGFSAIDCQLPSDLSVNDSVLFRFKYTMAADTSGAADVFINRQEFLLCSTQLAGWVPMLDAPSEAHPSRRVSTVIDMLVPSSFTLLAGGTLDSLSGKDGMTLWRILRSDVSSWEESFTVAGSKTVAAHAAAGDQGTCRVTLYTTPAVFDMHFADSLAALLGAASQYYAAQGCRPRYDRITFASLGVRSVNSTPVVSGNLVILRTGPESAVFDSSVFTSSANNVWLLETARAYAFDVPDSSYWFNESWAGYLSTRFLFAQSSTTERLQIRERSQLLAHALDFLPTYPIAAGRTSRMNEDAVFLYKGRYVFMMLEYILGAEPFNRVVHRLYDRSRSVPPGITAMQQLCESEYGSSLSWFFDQWLRRTGFPEYILASETAATPRGTYEVTVTVTQRGDMFTMPLNVYFEMAGKSFLKRVFVKDEQQRFSFVFPARPSKIEWNPQYLVLRWIPRYRILAHARTSTSYRVFNRDLQSSEREAQLTLQLDPDNNVGANSIALFSLGKAAGAMKEWTKAEEFFQRASLMREPEGYQFLPLLSLVRHANVLELMGNRPQAVVEYQRALETAVQHPLLYSPVIIEAKRCLERQYVHTDAAWYEYY